MARKKKKSSSASRNRAIFATAKSKPYRKRYGFKKKRR